MRNINLMSFMSSLPNDELFASHVPSSYWTFRVGNIFILYSTQGIFFLVVIFIIITKRNFQKIPCLIWYTFRNMNHKTC